MPATLSSPRVFGRFLRPLPFCALAMAGVHADIASILKNYRDSESSEVLVACHRAGYLSSGEKHLPENSVPAIRESIEAGTDILEIDLALTSDGELVLMHDIKLDRTTTGKGPVSDHTLAEIKSYRLLDPQGKETEEQVPTFRETMELAKGHAMVNLDKLDVTNAAKMEAAMKVLRETGTVDHAIFKGSASPKAVTKALKRYPEKLDFMPVVSNTSADRVISALDALKPEAIEIVFKQEDTPMLSPEVIAAAKRNGTRIWINSLFANLNAGHEDAKAIAGDPDGSWGWILSHGATIIQTDHRQSLTQYLEKEGKRHKAP